MKGVKDNFTDSEIVRALLRIIKLGNFKDMLFNKEDVTIAEPKGSLHMHLGENKTQNYYES